MDTNKRTLVTSIDIGDSVMCDICNVEFRGRDDSGGFIFGTYCVCPLCAPRMLKLLQEAGEENHIRERCPEGVTYHAWVMKLRGGNNTIQVFSVDP